MGAGEPLFLGDRWPSNIDSIFSQLSFSGCLFPMFFHSWSFRLLFFTIGIFAWTKTPPASFTVVRKTSKNTTMHCVPSACGFMENHCQDCCYLGYANIFCVCNLYDICHKIALKCVEATRTQVLVNHFCCTKRVTLKLLSQLTRET